MRRVRPRRVDFLHNVQDLRVLILGSLGFSTDFIERMTKLSTCQVIYRLAKGQTRRGDYRSGRSEIAAVVLSQADRQVVARVRARLAGPRIIKLGRKQA